MRPSKLNLQFYFPNSVHKSWKFILEKYCQILDHNMVTLHQVTMMEPFTSGEHVGIQHGHLRSRSREGIQHGHFTWGNPTWIDWKWQSLTLAMLPHYLLDQSDHTALLCPQTHTCSHNDPSISQLSKVVQKWGKWPLKRLLGGCEKKISPGGTLAGRGHPSQTHPWTRWRSGNFPAPQGGTRAAVPAAHPLFNTDSKLSG